MRPIDKVKVLIFLSSFILSPESSNGLDEEIRKKQTKGKSFTLILWQLIWLTIEVNPSEPHMPKAPSSGANPASIQQVAEHAGVSIATVSRVLNGVNKKFSKATSEKVMAAVASLGYRATGAGSALRRGQSRLVAVLASEHDQPRHGGHSSRY
jgi:transcriptional regulator with XRE-family HTH domain